MEFDNEMNIIMDSNSRNEAFARVSVMSFVSQLDPTMADITDIKTSVSEAVTNAIIHGYNNEKGKVYLKCGYKDNNVYIEIKDDGVGINNIKEAMEPLYTSKPEMERSGMGFTVMQTFMDSLEVISEEGNGTIVKMIKKISRS